MEPRRSTRRWGAVVVSGTLGATLLVATPPLAAAAVTPKAAQQVKSVSGSTVPVKPPTTGTGEQAPTKRPVTWPRGTTGLSASEKDAVRMEVLDQSESAKRGLAGLVVKMARKEAGKAAAPVSVSVDYNEFRHAYGGDWASRLRFVPLDGAPAAGPSRNDAKAGKVTAEVPVSSQDALFAVTAEPSGPSGDFTATPYSPAGEWSVSEQSGSFSWEYDLRVPPVPGLLVPKVTASYNSASVDGRVATTNNQTSWVGEGWDLSPGHIERRYRSCALDLGGNQGQTKTGDLCWATDNAMLSLPDRSGELVKDAAGRWHLKSDDGSRIERFSDGGGADNGDNNREFWRLTTTDGTQYTFGRNKMPDGRPDTRSVWTAPVAGNNDGEPCHKAAFGDSFCDQAYRWNLDHVVDRHGNTMIYTYEPETNKYGRDLGKTTVSYIRGGTLRRIDYGTRDGVGGDAPARVLFDVVDRCAPGADCSAKTAASWPDVPWDQDCADACTKKVAPTFWSTKRLASVTTQVNGGGYQNVERWTFDQDFPATGDNTSPALWLKGIGHTGLVGGEASTPAVTFVADPLNKANRVNSAPDGLPPGNKNRIRTVHTDSGGQIDVNYAPVNCSAGALPAPDANGLRCFPVRWAPDKADALDDWYHRYVVGSIALIDRVGGAPTQFTSYDYEGPAAWAYRDDPLVEEKHRTWNDWRGYEKVLVRKGDPNNPGDRTQSATRHQYFRGMNGDKVKAGGTKQVTVAGIADDPALQGFPRERITYNGLGGAEVSGTVNEAKVVETAAQGSLKSHLVRISATFDRTTLKTGGPRRSESRMTYDDVGQITQVNDTGDVNDPNDDRCTTKTYARNTGTWLLSLPSKEVQVGVACGVTPTLTQDLISDTRTYYDNAEHGAAPTTGNRTKVEALSNNGAGVGYRTRERVTYDQYGRPLDTYDAMDRKTTKAYAPATGLATSTTETNALGHTTTTTVNPAWGTTTAVVDANNARTDYRLDPLGRVIEAWASDRSKASGQGPTARFEYGLRTDGPSWITTQHLKANSNYVSSTILYDGFLRERQTQEPSPQGGRVLTDTFYGTRGLVTATNSEYYNASAPDKNLFAPLDNQIPKQTVTTYDGAERVTKETYEKLNEPQWSTTTEYGGDHTTVTPPQGGTPTTTYTDLRGRTTEVKLTADGGSTSTKRTYTKAGLLSTITDHVGNAWSFNYDLAGNRVRTVDPDKGISTATYDAGGQPVTETDARGQTVVTTYDGLGRRSSLRKDSATGPELTKWSYDVVKKGQLNTTTRYVDGKAYVQDVTAFDAANRPVDATVTIPDSEGALKGTYTTRTTYLADGTIGSIRMPKLGDALPEETVVYSYDSFGNPTKVKAGNTTLVSATTYTALGELTQLQLGADGQRTWQTTYYEEGTRRVESSLVERETTTAVRADETAYGYDAIGNVTRLDTTTAGSALDRQCMAYDGKRQLTEVWTTTAACAAPGASLGGPAPYWNSYRSDVIGRRTSVVRHGVGGAADTTATTTYPDAGQPRPHAPKSIASPSANGDYAYDQAGNTTTRPAAGGAQTLTWDSEGQLASATAGGATTTYVMTPENARLLAKGPTSTVLYLAGGELRLDKATNKLTGTRYYTHGDRVIASRTGGTVNYLIADKQGTGNLSVDAATLAHTKRRLDPFGVPRGNATPWPTSHGFVNGVNDPATGLTRLGVRDYDPDTGRFLSVDPLLDEGNPQHLDAYAYSFNNPTTFSDPDGTKPICDKFGDCRVGVDDTRGRPELWQEEEKRRQETDRRWQQEHNRRNKPGLAVDKGGNVQVGRKGKSLNQQQRDLIASFYGAVKASEELAWAPDGYNVSLCVEIPVAIAGVRGCLGGDNRGAFASVSAVTKQAVEVENIPRTVKGLVEPRVPQLSVKGGLGPAKEGWNNDVSWNTPVNVRNFGLKVGFNDNITEVKNFSLTFPASKSSVSYSYGFTAYFRNWGDAHAN